MTAETIILKALTQDGGSLEASFVPSKGMNLISYKKNNIEIIDQSTRDLFDQRYAGLGAIIGPHFHHRSLSNIPKIKNEALFPHIALLKAQGIQEPFSHGIGRYAPWQATHTEGSIKAVLSGNDIWNGMSLAELEGQNFTMHYEAALSSKGLHLYLAVDSDSSSVVGLHTYYALTGGGGRVTAKVHSQYNDHGQIKPIPDQWRFDEHTINLTMTEAYDFGFYPYPGPLDGQIFLQTNAYKLSVRYESAHQDNSWQLWHPQGKSFVCIEPLSAKDPRNPHLSASSLNVLLTIL